MFPVLSQYIFKKQQNPAINLSIGLTLFTPMSFFYTPWKRQKTFEMGHRREKG